MKVIPETPPLLPVTNRTQEVPKKINLDWFKKNYSFSLEEFKGIQLGSFVEQNIKNGQYFGEVKP